MVRQIFSGVWTKGCLKCILCSPSAPCLSPVVCVVWLHKSIISGMPSLKAETPYFYFAWVCKMKATCTCKTCRNNPLHLRQNIVSIHLRHAIRKRKDDLEKWPHVMRNVFGNFNGLQSNNRPQGISVLWFWFILKVAMTKLFYTF